MVYDDRTSPQLALTRGYRANPLLRVCHPPTYPAERRYIYDVLLRDFLGLEYMAETEARHDVLLTVVGDPGKQLILPDVLFQTPEDRWLTLASLPETPLDTWDAREDLRDARLVSPKLPVVYGSRLPGGSFCEASSPGVTLGLDIFGSAFFTLTRYEEVVKPVRDVRERFPATASLAYQEGFLDRPLVNEYLEVLWWALKRLWPGLRRRRQSFQMRLSHDVDRPFCTENLRRTLRSVAGDVVKRRKLAVARRRLGSFAAVRRRGLDADLCNTFDFIMDVSEEHGLVDTFNFMTGRSVSAIDGNYSMADPFIRKLWRRIYSRGHEIGLHTSYDSFDKPAQIRDEFTRLLRVAETEGTLQSNWGGRQHYLRWKAPATWQAWDDAGIDYDSTLSFADNAGFRCGVCHEYRVFNLETRTTLSLQEKPLVGMEVSVLGRDYMNLAPEEAEREILKLKNRCRLFDGEFTLLWHNNMLVDERDRDLYRRVVAA